MHTYVPYTYATVLIRMGLPVTTQEVSHEYLELDILEDSAQSSRTYTARMRTRLNGHDGPLGV